MFFCLKFTIQYPDTACMLYYKSKVDQNFRNVLIDRVTQKRCNQSFTMTIKQTKQKYENQQ